MLLYIVKEATTLVVDDEADIREHLILNGFNALVAKNAHHT